MTIIYETEKLKIEHEFEAIFLIDKLTGTILLEDDFYGDPTCGLIDKDNKWAIISGEHLTIWTPEKWKRIEDNDLKWIYAIRNKGSEIVEILTDPWNKNSAIWVIDTKTFKFKKVQEFKEYQDREYSENVVW